MSYQTAYTTHFRSLDNTLWDVAIYIDDYPDSPLEIKLEGDSPCVIEWQETGKTDVVQSSTCTLRVSNESDRQMAQLMGHPDAFVLVSRDGMPYWFGFLDDAIYEEPYSFQRAYVTELTFSDFGILNRTPFTLTGKQSVADIVDDCLETIGGGSVPNVNLYTSLLHLKPLQPITLDQLYVNADRFASDDGDSWGEMTTKRDVLEEILRPLGLRIMQKNGQIYIYDIEYLRDDGAMYNYIVWKGTDACLKGSETFGRYEVAFEPDVVETLAEIQLNLSGIIVDERYYAAICDENLAAAEQWDKGFFIRLPVVAALNADGRVFKTRPCLSSCDDAGYAWRVWCHDSLIGILPNAVHKVLNNGLVLDIASNVPSIPVAAALFKIETGYLPLVPGLADYQLRVNLDLLFSPKRNPMEPDGNWNFKRENSVVRPSIWNEMPQFYVPVKLELLDEQGNAVMHYSNTLPGYYPADPGRGQWLNGAASSFGDMLLAYYTEGLDRNPLADGWATNRQAMNISRSYLPSLYSRRADGEYVPMPPAAGAVRLTVSNCVMTFGDTHERLAQYRGYIRWHLLRNAKITLVKANRLDDGIDTDPIYSRNKPNPTADSFSETLKAGTWSKGIAPSARGLFFDASGTVWEKFVKNGSPRTLQEHRLRCIEDQTFYTQPVLSGTAELCNVFCAHRDLSTSGIFLVTALRQDLQQDTEEVTMARIAGVGGLVYDFEWSDPVCAKVVQQFSYAWSDPICAKEEPK